MKIISCIALFLLSALYIPFTHSVNDLSSDSSNHHHQDELTEIYLNYPEDGLGFDHWIEYGGHYETNIRHLKLRKSIKMLEIGVQSGGSTVVWQRYFTTGSGAEGREYSYIGVDINPNCRNFERPNENIRIFTASQANATFMQGLCEQFGPFDLIVDDGSHLSAHMKITFEAMYNLKCLKEGSVYVMEDTYAVIYRKWMGKKVSDAFRYDDNKDIYDFLAVLSRGIIDYDVLYNDEPPVNPYSKHIHSIVTYDSLIFFHFQEKWKPIQRFRKGKFIPY